MGRHKRKTTKEEIIHSYNQQIEGYRLGIKLVGKRKDYLKGKITELQGEIKKLQEGT